MDRLWAPWRSKYVQTVGEESSECFLCAYAAPGKEVERGIVWRWSHWYAVLNAYPYTNGHLLLALSRHHEGFVGLEDGESSELANALRHCEASVRQAYQPHGLNMGLNMGREAGAGVEGHLHIHFVPRWNGDTNFMTSIGETRVLPESLEESRERLRAAFEGTDAS